MTNVLVTIQSSKMATEPKHEAPHGMEPYDLSKEGDLGALSSEQQAKLNKFKIKTRMENEAYLRKHPEVECLLTGFLGDVLTQRPDNIRDFASDYFTDSNLPTKLTKQLEDRQQNMRQNRVLKKL